MFDGIYRIAFTGNAGSGLGVLVFRDGKVAGADVAGATYDGTFEVDGAKGELAFEARMDAPAGIIPVQTGQVLREPMSMPISGRIALADVAAGKPVLLRMTLGAVNVLLTKIRAL